MAARRQLQRIFASRGFGLGAAFTAIGIVLVTALLTLRSAQNLAHGRTQVDHTHTVIETIQAVMSRIDLAESGQRGYVITGQEDFLPQVRDAEREARRSLDYLQMLIADNPDQRAAAAEFQRLLNEKFDYVSSSIALRQTRGLPAAATTITLGRGQALADSLHRLADQMEARERALLLARSSRDSTNLQRAERLGVVAILIALGFALLAVYLLRRAVAILEGSRRRSTYLKSLVNATSDGIYGVDKNGNITLVNQSMATTLGYRPDELIGQSAHVTIHHTRVDGTPFPEVECPIYQVVQNGRSAKVDNDVIWRRDGTSIPVEYSVAPVLDARGREGAVVSFRDITERQRAEAALRQGKEAAEAASAQKSDFLARMSHELRTPLNSVIGFANVLKRNPRNTLEATDLEYIERIRKNGVHLLELINDILDVTKIESGKMELEIEPVDLGMIVREVVTQFESQIGTKTLEIECVIPDRLLPVRADRIRLHQVLLNLVGNAVKFTESGGVTVTVSADPGGQPLRIDIADTGIGIPADRLAAIFAPFEQAERTTTRRFGGTGLGLAISRTLCEMMGFSLTVASTEGSGSTFTIDLAPRD